MSPGRTSGPGPGECAYEELRHHCWGERAELVVGEERGPQNRGRMQEWTQLGLHFGEKAELGAQVQPRCRNSPTLPSLQAASQTPSCPEPDPFPTLGSAPFEVLQSRGRPGGGSERRSPFSFHPFCPEASSPTSAHAPWLLAAGHRPTQARLILLCPG